MRFFRWIMIAGAVIVGLVILAIAIGALWLNTFIHSASFRAEIQDRASRSLDCPVQVGSVDFDIFHGLKLQNFVAQIDPGHSGGQGALKIQIASANCTYSLPDLLNRRLRLTGVTLDQPRIVLTQQPTAPLAPADTSPPNPPAPSASAPAESLEQNGANAFQFVLDKVKVSNGSVSVQDAKGTTMVGLQGLDIVADTSGYNQGKDVTGSVRLADLSASNLHVTQFSTPFRYRQGIFDANPFEASAFGGRIAGDYQLGNSGPSILDLNAKGIDVAQLTASTVSKSSARLSGALDLQTKWRGLETGDLNGEGDAQLVSGKLEGVKILHSLSQILRVKELDAPVITQARTHFVVQNRQTQFIGLQLASSIFQITGDGTINFNGSLNANLVLILTRDGMAKLPSEAAASFVQQQDGTGSIAFQVTGTTSNPQTDLPARLLMQNTQIKNAIDKALNKFFH